MVVTTKSSNNQPASIITIPFMKRRKIPRVRTVIGIVSTTKRGFKKVLSRARTSATQMAETKPETNMPGSKIADIYTATAEIKSFKINAIFLNFKGELFLFLFWIWNFPHIAPETLPTI